MNESVFNLLKGCEGQKLQVAYYDKEADMWVLVFEHKALLVESIEEISDPDAYISRTLEAELPYAQSMEKLSNIAKARKELADRETAKDQEQTQKVINHLKETHGPATSN
jgi:hypothetical protein